MTVNVLGTDYTIIRCNYKDKPIFEKRSIDGYHDPLNKEIVIVNMRTYPGFEEETEDYCRRMEKEVLRHELTHAFLCESGLNESSLQYSAGWAKNEEMVDWIAFQFPKILEVFKAADCL